MEELHEVVERIADDAEFTGKEVKEIMEKMIDYAEYVLNSRKRMYDFVMHLKDRG